MLNCSEKGAYGELRKGVPATLARRRRDATINRLNLRGVLFERGFGTQDRRNYVLIADRGVDHHVIEAAGWPVRVEIALHEGDSIPIDLVQQILGFYCAFA